MAQINYELSSFSNFQETPLKHCKFNNTFFDFSDCMALHSPQYAPANCYTLPHIFKDPWSFCLLRTTSSSNSTISAFLRDVALPKVSIDSVMQNYFISFLLNF